MLRKTVKFDSDLKLTTISDQDSLESSVANAYHEQSLSELTLTILHQVMKQKLRTSQVQSLVCVKLWRRKIKQEISKVFHQRAILSFFNAWVKFITTPQAERVEQLSDYTSQAVEAHLYLSDSKDCWLSHQIIYLIFLHTPKQTCSIQKSLHKLFLDMKAHQNNHHNRSVSACVFSRQPSSIFIKLLGAALFITVYVYTISMLS